jgi:Flp pilus assembly protein TadB
VFGLGVFLLACALRARPSTWAETPKSAPRARRSVEKLELRVGLAVAGGLVAAVVTGWPVGIALAAAGGFWVPSLLGSRAVRGRRQARLEGLASWTEQLRDVMAAAAGLEQAVIATAAFAPVALREEVTALAAALESGTAPRTALRRFAEAVDDPAGDLVVAALILASEGSPRHLADLLGRLAAASRDTVTMRLRVETGRARTRSSVRLVTSITVAFSVGIVVFNPTYVEVYNSALGQVVLTAVAVFFAGAYWWLARSTIESNEGRFLTTTTTQTTASVR